MESRSETVAERAAEILKSWRPDTAADSQGRAVVLSGVQQGLPRYVFTLDGAGRWVGAVIDAATGEFLPRWLATLAGPIDGPERVAHAIRSAVGGWEMLEEAAREAMDRAGRTGRGPRR